MTSLLMFSGVHLKKLLIFRCLSAGKRVSYLCVVHRFCCFPVVNVLH